MKMEDMKKIRGLKVFGEKLIPQVHISVPFLLDKLVEEIHCAIVSDISMSLTNLLENWKG